jgi:hypothetical protein
MTPPPGERATRRQHLLAIAAFALFAIHPLMVHGASSGHDFDFHMVNWMEAASQFSHGNLYPHWAFGPAYNAGEPRFVFYPPLSWMLGGILGLLLTHLPGVSQEAAWSAAPIVFTWVALTLAGSTLYRLARMFTGANASLLAAVLYIANPYMLFTAFERTAYGELLAAAWIPLLLLAMLQDEVRIARIAIAVALLWLTNAPAAVMGCYSLALLAAVRVATAARASGRGAALKLAWKAAAGTGLGLALAALYIVPAAYERRFVQISMVMIEGMRIDHNFLFEHTGTTGDALLHDQVLHTASMIAVAMLAATLLALVALYMQRRVEASARGSAFPTAALAILAAGIGFLLTPASVLLWRYAPQAQFLQFPWRLLAVLAAVFALAIAAALERARGAVHPAVTALLAVALVLPGYHLFRQPSYQEDTPTALLADFQRRDGFDPTDEYTPRTADNDALKENSPGYWLAASPTAPAPSGLDADSAPMHFTETAPSAGFLVLNLRDYPAWRVWLNGALAPARMRRKDGLIALSVPAGTSTLDIRYAHTPDQTLGDVLSLLGVLVLARLWMRDRVPSG